MSKSLPPGWRRVRLGDVLEPVNRFEKLDPDREYRLLGVKWYAQGVFEREPKFGKVIAAKQLNRVEEGDFVYNRLFAWKGSFAVVGNGHAGGYVSGEFPVFRAKPDAILAEFLYRHFSRPQAWRLVEHHSTGTTNMSRNRWREEQFLSWHISLPPINEQERIIATLRGADDAIEANIEVIARTLALKKSLADELLRRGLPGVHTRFKDSALGRIPEAWEVRRLDEVARVERGKFTHRPRNEPSMYGGATPFVQTGDITASGWYLHGYSQTLSERGLTVSRLFPAGTILLAIAQTRGNIGATTITRFPVAFPDSVVGITPNAGFTPEYLLTALEHAQRRIIGAATESAQANLSLDLLRPVPIEVPTKAERELITKAVKDIEQCLERAHENLKSLRVLRDGLLPSLLLAGSTETGATQRREV